jgi:ABC-type antimicrobial peptide transport system permease subunit
MTTIVSTSLARSTFLTLLLAIAGATALLLAAIGIFGVVASAVRQRRAEVGLRIALGAPRAHVVALVVRETGVIVTVGTLIGVPLSLAGTGVLRAILFGVAPGDPATLLGAICVLLFAALLACYIPARRAARLDPVTALRSA